MNYIKETKKLFLSVLVIGVLVSAFSYPKFAEAATIRSVLGCDGSGENCQTGRVSQGQTLFVSVSGLTDDELSDASITLDDVSFISETIVVGNTLKLYIRADDVDFGTYALSIRGAFDTINYPGGITVARAAGNGNNNSNNSSDSGSTGGGSISTGLDKIKDQFPTGGDLGQSRTVGDIIIAVIKILLGLLLAVAVLFIIIGGFQYVTSAGNEDQAKKGRKTLTYAIIGLVIVILAYTLVNVVINSVSSPSI